MRGISRLSSLIEEIYDAALEPAAWNDIVVGINDFVGGKACGLISKDTMSQSGLTYYYCGVDPHYIQLYSDTHARYDHLAVLPQLGQVVSIPDLLEYDEYRSGPFYQEWLRPQGCVDIANVVLEKSGSTSAVLLAVLTGTRMADEEMRRRIALIAPHAHKALLINKAIDRRQSEAATFAGTLDGLGAGIFLLDVGGRIVHANRSGHDMLSEDDFLRCIGGRLVARDPRVNQDLRDIFTGNGGVSNEAAGAALPLTAHDGERYVAHLLPLTSAARSSTGTAYNAVIAMFVRRVALDGPSDEVLARTFKLTPSELRVLTAVSEIGGVAAIAGALGISEATVKTHLQHLFAKTGANRQADLVKLVAAYASPLRREF